MRYAFIREHRQEFSVQRMCRVLDVTRSGYYAWQPEKLGPRAQENQALIEHIRKEYMVIRQTYGSPRIWSALQGQGITCGRQRVACLMRREGLRPKKRRRWHPVTTQRQVGVIPAPNHLNQNFSAAWPDTKSVSDFTYIDTAEGWLHLASRLISVSSSLVKVRNAMRFGILSS